MGLGLDNVVKVPTNREGEMRPDALQIAIQEVKASGRVPLAVNATAGTSIRENSTSFKYVFMYIA